MLICHHCHKILEIPEGTTGRVVCPHCRTEIEIPTVLKPHHLSSTKMVKVQDTEAASDQWSTVARSTNIAEIGYLADLLESYGTKVQIEQHDSFSALDGNWTSLFLLQVPSEEAAGAAHRVHERLVQDQTDAEKETTPPSELTFESAPPHVMDPPVFWRPVALMVFAGAALLFVGHRMRLLKGPDPNPPNPPSLLRTLESIDQPFVSQPSPMDPKRHRILYDRRQHLWYLDTDLDGNGTYDRRHTFH